MKYEDVPEQYRCNACGYKDAQRIIRRHRDGASSLIEKLAHQIPGKKVVCSGQSTVPAEPKQHEPVEISKSESTSIYAPYDNAADWYLHNPSHLD